MYISKVISAAALLSTIAITYTFTSANEVSSSHTEKKSTQASKKRLDPFYVAFQEWDGEGCIVSANKQTFEKKQLICQVLESGKLKIRVNNEFVTLHPKEDKKLSSGTWENQYKNKDMQINLKVDLSKQSLYKKISGYGTVQIISANDTLEQKAFFAAKQ